MLLFEEHAAMLLIAHTFFALATVALSTHLVSWLRHFLRGRFEKRQRTVRFAVLSASAYAITMLLGMALYPTYKIRVRAEYLDNPSRIHRAVEATSKSQILTRARNEELRRYRSGQGPETSAISEALATVTPEADQEAVAALAESKVVRGIKLIRWFDVKEHWALLGLLLSLAVCGILLSWKPNKDKGSKSIAKAVTALALGAACISWAAAIIGISTAAARSVAAL